MNAWRSLIYLWPLLFALMAIALLCWRTPRTWLKYSTLSLLTATFCVTSFLHLSQEVRYTTTIPGYRVELYEPTSYLYFDIPRYFNLYRADGKQAQFQIDIDVARCIAPKIIPKADNLYFQCAGERLKHSSYVNPKKLTVYSGWYKTETAIADLDFQ